MASTLDIQRRFVLAHELAHQWSPSLVGTNAHRSPVVDEPLAQYLAGRAIQDEVEQKGRCSGTRMSAQLRNISAEGGEDAPADRPTGDYSGALEYAALIYGKAPYFYVDLEERIGQRRLDSAIRGAIADLSWRVVDGREWLVALETRGALALERWVSGGGRGFGDEDLELDPEGTERWP